jgi:hypothetical protein
MSWPVIVLCGGVVLTLAGNLAMAEHSPWGWVMAGIPAVALLLAISMIERRAAGAVAEGSDAATTATTSPPVTAVAAMNGHRPSAQPVEPATAQGGTQATMRAHWDAEVAAGRIPTGAALNRAAGKDPNYSLGKRYAAAWKREGAGV